MKRKPISIAVIPDATVNRFVVLCDDGTVWGLHPDRHTNHVWVRLPDVPQPESEPS